MSQEQIRSNSKRLVSYVNENEYIDIADVNLQDQTTQILIIPANKITNSTLITSATVIGGRTVDVESVTGIIERDPDSGVEGSFILIFSNVTNRAYIGRVTNVTGLTLTMDTEFDSVLPIGANLDISTTELSVDGSVTPAIFGIRGSSDAGAISSTYDITRMIMTMTCDSEASLATFGDITPLLNGLVLRHRNGSVQNIFNVKSNKGIAGICYDLDIFAANNPQQGQDGLKARTTFAGQNKIGVAIRVGPGEDLEIVVQDDLTDITKFQIIFEGHEVL